MIYTVILIIGSFSTLVLGLYFHTVASEQRDNATESSYEHYVVASRAVYAAVTVIVSGVTVGLALGMVGLYTLSIPLTFVSLCWVLVLRDDIKKRDDWFNSRLKKRLKRWLKELRRRLSQAPLPLPAA